MGINPKLAGIHLSTDLRRVCDELSGGVIKSVVADIDSKVCAIGQVEGFGENFEPGAGGDIHSAGDSQVCGEVSGTDKRVALVTRQPVVVSVAILISVACHGGVERPAGAKRKDAGKLPVVQQCIEHGVIQLQWARLDNAGGQEAISLVGDAESAFQRSSVNVLHIAGTSNN